MYAVASRPLIGWQSVITCGVGILINPGVKTAIYTTINMLLFDEVIR